MIRSVKAACLVLLACFSASGFCQPRVADAWAEYCEYPSEELFSAYTAELRRSFADGQSVTELLPYTAGEFLFYTVFIQHHYPWQQEEDAPVLDFEKIFEKYAVPEKNIRKLLVIYALFSFYAQDPAVRRSLNPSEIPEQLFLPVFAAVPEKIVAIPAEQAQRFSYVRAKAEAEALLHGFEYARERQKEAVSFQLSENAFLRILNDPALVHVLYGENRYYSVLTAFLRSASASADAHKNSENGGNRFSPEADGNISEEPLKQKNLYEPILLSEKGILFPFDLYTTVFRSVPDEKKEPAAESIYALHDIMPRCRNAAEQYGIPLERILTEETAALFAAAEQYPDILLSLPPEQCAAALGEIAFIADSCGIYAPRIRALMHRENSNVLQ
ncbi:MAG: hypothetical protein NC041_04955 [Bacteroides sp.]|nr:hypothetical protein [Prevotella sp.]MCM1407306.1 hypothetical protein [Treponema brennaborense]MCM1469796.1 hypothetical protein [Bacteroides sp.]